MFPLFLPSLAILDFEPSYLAILVWYARALFWACLGLETRFWAPLLTMESSLLSRNKLHIKTVLLSSKLAIIGDICDIWLDVQTHMPLIRADLLQRRCALSGRTPPVGNQAKKIT